MSATATRTRLLDFFADLAEDSALLAEHERQPHATMAAAGLSPRQIGAVLAGPATLRDAIDDELGQDPVRRRLVIRPRMTLHTPTPDPPDDGEPPGPQPDPAPQ